MCIGGFWFWALFHFFEFKIKFFGLFQFQPYDYSYLSFSWDFYLYVLSVILVCLLFWSILMGFLLIWILFYLLTFCDIFLSSNAVIHEVMSEVFSFIFQKKFLSLSKFFLTIINLFDHVLLSSSLLLSLNWGLCYRFFTTSHCTKLHHLFYLSSSLF